MTFSPDIIPINQENYIYLASQYKINSVDMTDFKDNNITYKYDVYNIPAGKTFIKVDLLNENNLGIKLYDYEFGPIENAKNIIKNRLEKKNQQTTKPTEKQTEQTNNNILLKLILFY